MSRVSVDDEGGGQSFQIKRTPEIKKARKHEGLCTLKELQVCWHGWAISSRGEMMGMERP